MKFFLRLSIFTIISTPGFSYPSPSQVITPTIPRKIPTDATEFLDRALGSLSIELSYFTDFAGNLSHPNELFARAIDNIYKRTGVHPAIRPGGITADSAWFDPDADVALSRDLSTSGGIYRTTLGSAWYESFSTLPRDIQYVVDVNLENNSLPLTIEQVRSALQYIPRNQITAFELGNEGDHYSSTFDEESGNSPWSMYSYTRKYLNWTSSIAQALNITTPVFSAGTFADDPPTGTFNISGILALGADSNGLTLAYSQHMYQYSSCDPYRNSKATLPNLINHKNITSYVDLWIPQIEAAVAAGGEFFVGEYNSVSCSGKINVTDTFGQALWVLDTTLWSAYRGVRRMYLHNGATLILQSSDQANTAGYSKYNLIFPQSTSETGPARLSPSYVSYLLLGEAVGPSGESRMSPIASENDDIAIYGIWEDDGKEPERIVVLNMTPYNGTSGAWDWNFESDVAAEESREERPGVFVNLKALGKELTVKRMSSTGLNEKNPHLVTWAGQEYFSGTPAGQYEEETVKDGKVWVGASEAVLIFTENRNKGRSPY
ncbi:hypothetical protein RUND412_010163 [Rhizina undulata]